MLSYQDRLNIERDELNDRISKLKNFIANNETFRNLQEAERGRMTRQLEAMTEYSQILAERLKFARR